jgi:hypothetical protein
VPRPAPADFAAGALDRLLVRGVLPLHQALDDAEQAFALALLQRFGREQLRPGRGVVHQLREEHGARSGQRTARPPSVQREGVPMDGRLFPDAGGIDGVERQGDLDQFLPRGHDDASSLIS